MDVEWEHAVVLLLSGTLVALGILIKRGLQKTAIPALVGYLLLGFLLRVTGTAASFFCNGDGVGGDMHPFTADPEPDARSLETAITSDKAAAVFIRRLN